MIQKNKRALLTLSLLVSLLLVGGFIYYRFFIFHIIAISPNNSRFPSSAQTISIAFNKPLDTTSVTSENITVTPELAQDITIKERSIEIKLRQAVEEGGSFQVKLSGIKAEDGDEISKTINFEVIYVPFKDLPQEEQERQIKTSDSFEDEFPITKHLPFMSINYDIDYRFPGVDEEKMPLIISVHNELPRPAKNTPNNSPQMRAYLNEIRTYRREAIKYLENIGYTPDKYQLVFAEPVLLEEFDGKSLDTPDPTPQTEGR